MLRWWWQGSASALITIELSGEEAATEPGMLSVVAESGLSGKSSPVLPGDLGGSDPTNLGSSWAISGRKPGRIQHYG
jgi:hypothetical protein